MKKNTKNMDKDNENQWDASHIESNRHEDETDPLQKSSHNDGEEPNATSENSGSFEDVFSDHATEDIEESTRKRMAEIEGKCAQYKDKMQRMGADFENYKKRVAKEKENTYTDAVAEAIMAFLPIVDNFERALKTPGEPNENAYKTGLELLYKQFGDAFKKLRVEEIETVGRKFDPLYHNAVMHIEDEAYQEGQIVEVFQKGYLLGEKVIRHSMVKVAN
jgi:molecular chaperone GrpE